jgi:hypothetical protein
LPSAALEVEITPDADVGWAKELEVVAQDLLHDLTIAGDVRAVHIASKLDMVDVLHHCTSVRIFGR